MEKNHYEILGIAQNAKPEEIQNAYRKLVKKYHPDVNPGNEEAEEMMKSINVAYSVLMDEELRKRYDEEINIDRASSNKQQKTNNEKKTETHKNSEYNAAWDNMKRYFYRKSLY